MSYPRPATLFTYGLLSGAARVVVPPVVDLPFVRTVRGVMFERIARSAQLTMSGEARRTLADLEAPASARGVAEQAARWLAGKVLPGAMVFDVGRTVLTTYAAGALFVRYCEKHRATPSDPVFDAIEAEAVRHGLRESLELFSPEHLRALVRVAEAALGAGTGSTAPSLPGKVGEALAAGALAIPTEWLNGLEEAFTREVALRRRVKTTEAVVVGLAR